MGNVGKSTRPAQSATHPVFSYFCPVIRRSEPGKIVLGWPVWVSLLAGIEPVVFVLGVAVLVGALVAGELSRAAIWGMVGSLGALFVKFIKFVICTPWVTFEVSPPLMTTRWLCFRKPRRESLTDLTSVQVLSSDGPLRFHQVSLTFPPPRPELILANTKNRGKAMFVAQVIADCLGVALSEREYRPTLQQAIPAGPKAFPGCSPALTKLILISALVVGLITGVVGCVLSDLWIRRQNLGIVERVAERAGGFVGFLGGAIVGFVFVLFLAFVVTIYWFVIKWVMAEIRKSRR